MRNKILDAIDVELGRGPVYRIPSLPVDMSSRSMAESGTVIANKMIQNPCPDCGTQMKQLFLLNSFFCPKDCDRKKTSKKINWISYWVASAFGIPKVGENVGLRYSGHNKFKTFEEAIEAVRRAHGGKDTPFTGIAISSEGIVVDIREYEP